MVIQILVSWVSVAFLEDPGQLSYDVGQHSRGMNQIQKNTQEPDTYNFLLFCEPVPGIPDHAAKLSLSLRMQCFQFQVLLPKEKIVARPIRAWCIWVFFSFYTFPPWALNSCYLSARHLRVCTKCPCIVGHVGMLQAPMALWQVI